MNILCENPEVMKQIRDTQLMPPYNRIIRRILDTGVVENETTGKGVKPIEKGIKAIALLPTKYFVVEIFEHEKIPDVKVFFVFGFVDTENDNIPGSQLQTYLKNTYTRQRRATFFTDDDLISYAHSFIAKDDDALQPKPELPLQYSGWLEHLDADYVFEGYNPLFVRETRDWNRHFNSASFDKRFYIPLYDKLRTIFYDEDEATLLGGGGQECRLVEGETNDGFYLLRGFGPSEALCRYQMGTTLDLSGSDGDNNSGRKMITCRELTLIDIWEPEAKSEETGSNDEEKVRDIIKRYREDYEEKKIRAFRYYPGKVFANRGRDDKTKGDYYRWEAMELSEKPVCIEFSDEELSIICGHDRRFPILVNGSAGSGKSTALYWLFVAYWLKSREDSLLGEHSRQMVGVPMFLTLSDVLRRYAKTMIVDIIRFSSDIGWKLSEKEINDAVAPCMRSFDSLLREFLNDSDATVSFCDEKYKIQFETFKKLLMGDQSLTSEFVRYTYKQGRPKYSAELCWHIIRSYIKGFPGRDFYDKSAFLEFIETRRASNDIFVDKDSFLYVWDVVWPWYRNLTDAESKFWDQQDLVLKVLSELDRHKDDLPKCLTDVAAVFCDEAQDFTGIELHFIQRLSKLLRYQIPQDSHPELPLAFAGDPLQTLNPSGFRWEDLQRSLNENILEASGVLYRISPKHLNKNFRSPQRVVRLANMVHLSRKMFFGDDLHPQNPDKNELGAIHCTIREKNSTLSEDEVQQLEGCVILLPCSSGDEERDSFIERYPLLKSMVACGKAKDEILSVLDAKGMDIARVVLFAFGDALFGDSSTSFPKCTDGKCKDVSVSYALNKVYVGITRVTEQLGIIDTAVGIKRFWSQLCTSTTRKRYLEALGAEADRAQWESLLPWDEEELESYMRDGIFGHDNKGMSEEALIAEGTGWFEDAYLMENAQQMRLAAGRFERFKRTRNRQLICEGFAKMFNGNYEGAAQQFLEARECNGQDRIDIGAQTIDIVEKRLDCLWEAMTTESWESLSKWQTALRERQMGYGLVARVMLSEALSSRLIEDIVGFRPDQLIHIRRASQWEACLKRMCKLVDEADGKFETLEIDREELLEFARFLGTRALERARFRFCAAAAIKVYNALIQENNNDGYWKEAYELIQKCGGMLSGLETECYTIVAHCTPWPTYALNGMKAGGDPTARFCVDKWMRERAEKDELLLKNYSYEDQRGFIKLLLRVATDWAKVDLDSVKVPKLRREAVRVALSLRLLEPILDYEDELLPIMSLEQKEGMVIGLLDRPKPLWEEAAKVFKHWISADGVTPVRINDILRSICNIDAGILRSSGVKDFLVDINNSLLGNAIGWPTCGDDLRLAAMVFKKIGLDKVMSEFASDVRLRHQDDVMQVAGEMYVYARHLFVSSSRCKEKEIERRRTADNFTNWFARSGQDATSLFNQYWAAAERGDISFEPATQRDGGWAGSVLRNLSTMGSPCVQGAKWDEDNENYRLIKAPFKFIETAAKVTIVRRDNEQALAERAVIIKADWKNTVGELRNVRVYPGVEGASYTVLHNGVSIDFKGWTSSVLIKF